MTANWIATDWGTSRLRVWVMDARDQVIAELSSARGVNLLGPADYEPTLLDLLERHLPRRGKLPVLICGMAGSRQGWVQAPYVSVPCAPPDVRQAMAVETEDKRLDVRILPGVSQSDPADVMRGEETRIAGFMAAHPNFDGVVCLPGTHTKWVQVSAGEIVSFRTAMTGELFALLSDRSILRHSLTDKGWDEPAFVAALQDAMGAPQHLTARLFGLRAESLLENLPPRAARARLSGLLIGVDLAGAKGYWLGQNVAVVGSGGLAGHYVRALTEQGVAPLRADAADMTLAGLRAARKAAA
ncbi:2-dehydro-3-deoxygalactonokinase [Jhaorihella thermophila]|nr:2-dehydro-3-deoxygalactonokinase [Jhaorihella thermophila]